MGSPTAVSAQKANGFDRCQHPHDNSRAGLAPRPVSTPPGPAAIDHPQVETAVCSFAEKFVMQGRTKDATRLLLLASGLSGTVRVHDKHLRFAHCPLELRLGSHHPSNLVPRVGGFIPRTLSAFVAAATVVVDAQIQTAAEKSSARTYLKPEFYVMLVLSFMLLMSGMVEDVVHSSSCSHVRFCSSGADQRPSKQSRARLFCLVGESVVGGSLFG